MPLTAPKVPRYTQRESLPAGLPTDYADLRPSQQIGGAYEKLGNVLIARAQVLQQQRDAAVVGDLYNQWRDQDRQALSELLAKKGKDAYNLDKQYDEFFNKSFEKTNEGSENGEQQLALKELLDRKREQNLDILARYQAEEGKRYLAEVEAGRVFQAEKDIRQAGFQSGAVAETIGDLYQWLESAHPGEDITALKKKYKSTMLYANMQERIDQNPEAAGKALEAWKMDLGEEQYLSLKNDIKTKSKQYAIDRIQSELQTKYESNGVPDFTKMRQDLTHSKMEPDIKFEVRQWLDAYETQYNNAQTGSNKTAHDDEERNIGMAFLNGNYASVMNQLRKSQFLKGDELKTWATAVKDAANKKTPVDPVQRAAAIVKINQMITQEWPQEEIKKQIIITPYLEDQDKEQYINKLETKLTGEIEAGKREGYAAIVNMIFPKIQGAYAKIENLVQTPQQTIAIARAQGELDEWIKHQLQLKKYPTRNEIRMKGIELGQANQVPMAERMKFLQEQQENLEKQIE